MCERFGRNIDHYNAVYSRTNIDGVIARAREFREFLADATRTHTSWVALYASGLERRLHQARVLELGFGNGLNALIMAQLGAEVTAIEISKYAVELLATASKELHLQHRIEPIHGDFIEIDLPCSHYDFVLGKAFLHHLTHEIERDYVAKTSSILKPSGEARFCEPAVNSRFLDFLRWVVPVSGRPSILMRQAFQRWKEQDPHPTRDNSSRHYERVFRQYFRDVEIWPIGCLERFHRLLPAGRFNLQYRRWALRFELALLPYSLRLKCARAQTIVARGPRR